MAVLKETNEFTTSLVNTFAQGVESFGDGFQITDVADFVDEALSWEQAIRGISSFKDEAAKAKPEDIEAMFAPHLTRMKEAGLNEVLAGAIVTNLKGIYYTYAAIVQNGAEVVKK